MSKVQSESVMCSSSWKAKDKPEDSDEIYDASVSIIFYSSTRIHHQLPAMDAHFPTSRNFGILIPSSLGSYYVEDQLI